MAVPFRTGFNDGWGQYGSWTWGPQNALDYLIPKVAQCGGQVVRFPVSWQDIEPTGAGQGNWVSANYNYTYLAMKCKEYGIKLLPNVTGCPSWVQRERCRPECNPVWFQGPNPPARPPYCQVVDDWNVFYPVGQGCTEYGNFLVRCLTHFKDCGLIDSIEVWNEPNLRGEDQGAHTAFIGDPSAFNSMLSTSINVVRAYDPSIKVCSGGLYLNPTPIQDAAKGIDWQTYLDAFVNQSYSYALGVHPYDIRPHNNKSRAAAENEIIARVSQLYNQVESYLLAVHGIATQEIWVNETGCHSRAPLTEASQELVIRILAGSVPNSFFKTKGNCKMVRLHRFFPSGHDNPSTPQPLDGPEGLGTPFYEFSVLRADTSSKAAHAALGWDWL